ncbi:hypothetical protein [Mobilicoccus pelagius]|uniref:Uncharacterized protein n=1 Tax=Mobilicoccus pelagius NBRC 104925 TaxID=1089455 RepID=H5UTR2_9MICO|nr:hypothetical protein [Mobilicoccus pelagius]GAB49120.1 hypothetical protein MOPEL_096_01280 [Mobilicoccus pelagius NBRC 104925]
MHQAGEGWSRRIGVRRFAAVASVLLPVVLTGCAGGPAPAPVSRPVVSVPPPEIVTVAPTTAAPTHGVDVDAAAIRSAPAACGLPLHHLSSHRGSIGTTETTLQVTDGYAMGMAPVPPVETDVTGDGGLDLIGVLSCTVDDDPRPDTLVLYTGPATPAASVGLDTAQKQKYAVVRDLRVVGGDVRVEWTAFDRADGPVTQYEATVSWRGDRLALVDPRRSSGPRRVTVSTGSFLTADGNVHCVVHDDVAWCDVARSTWTPPPSPPPSASRRPSTSPTPSGTASSAGAPSASPASACEGREYGRTFLIRAGRVTRMCAGEQGPEIAALGAPLASWHRTGWDATVVVDGRRSAALTPGSSMSSAQITCSATSEAVTCTDTRTRASFEVGRGVADVSTD